VDFKAPRPNTPTVSREGYAFSGLVQILKRVILMLCRTVLLTAKHDGKLDYRALYRPGLDLHIYLEWF